MEAERNALLRALDEREGTFKALLDQTERSIKEAQALVKEGQVLASLIDGTADKFLPLMAPGDKDRDLGAIAEMQETLKLASSAVRETDGLLKSVDRLLNSPRRSGEPSSVIKIFQVAGNEVDDISDHLFLVVAGLILVVVFAVVAGAFAHRYLTSRFPMKPIPPSV